MDAGLKSCISDRAVVTSNFGDEYDRKLIAKVTDVLCGERISVGKAMAILDATRTAILKNALESTLP